MLLFCSLGWQLPLRVHMPLQALTIAMLMRFAVHPYCHSKVCRCRRRRSCCRRSRPGPSITAGWLS